MTKTGRIAVAAIAVLIAAATFEAWRLYVHAGNLFPAVITPQMDAQRAVSPGLGDRLERLWRERVPGNTRGKKLVALTFDDGPYPVFTPLLLDQLRALNVRATFFLIGRDVEQWPDLARRIEADGHEVADHTYSHPNLDEETPARVREEILLGRDVVSRYVHDPGLREYMRPPHGRFTVDTIRVAQQLGYTVVLWTDDSGDWRSVTQGELADHVIDYATAPDIVLMHSGRLATIEALNRIVSRFRQAGFRFVTVGEMLRVIGPNGVNEPERHALQQAGGRGA